MPLIRLFGLFLILYGLYNAFSVTCVTFLGCLMFCCKERP